MVFLLPYRLLGEKKIHFIILWKSLYYRWETITLRNFLLTSILQFKFKKTILSLNCYKKYWLQKKQSQISCLLFLSKKAGINFNTNTVNEIPPPFT